MYKLIIVDDEYFARELYRKFLNWDELGFEIAAVFSDGEFALEYMETNKVDVVLTDINMVNINGLELVSEITKKHSETIVIFISGHRDFEYALGAVKNNVFDYLLKPVGYSEFYDVFLRVAKELDLRRKSKILTDNVFSSESLLLERQRFLASYIGGDPYTEEIAVEKLNALGFDAKAFSAETALVTIRFQNVVSYLTGSWHHEKCSVTNALDYVLQSEDPFAHVIPIPHTFDSAVLCILDKSRDSEFKPRVERLCENALLNLSDILQLSAQIVQTQFFNRLSDARLETDISDISLCVGKLAEYLFEGKRDDALRYAHTIFEQNKDDDAFLTVIANDLYARVSELISLPFSADIGNPCKDDEIKSLILKIIFFSSTQLANTTETFYRTAIEKATKYMRVHYGGDVSQFDVASNVSMNVSQFRKMFKEITGERFIDYLIKIRMEKAMEFLKDTDYKVSRICSMIGYKKEAYFFKLFKAHTGQTPQEYRRNMQLSEKNEE